MNWLDILIIVAVGTSVVIGVLRGIVRECFSLASYLIGYLAATATYTLFSDHLKGIINNPQAREVISFGVIFVIALILVNLVGRLLRKLISKKKALSFVDRMIGLTFGFCRGVIILALLMIPLSLFPVIGSQAIRGSVVAPYLMVASRELSNWAFSDRNVMESLNIKVKMDSLKEKIGGGVESIKKAARNVKGKVSEKLSENTLGILKKNKKNDEDKDTGITQKDREKLNQLLEGL